MSREVHRFPAVIVTTGGCTCRTQHKRVTGDLPDTHALALAIQAAWDAEFTGATDRGLDYRMALKAAEVALGQANSSEGEQ
jgi:hypothetical protein